VLYQKTRAIPEEPPAIGDLAEDHGQKTHVAKDDQAPPAPVEADAPQDAAQVVVAPKPDGGPHVAEATDAIVALQPVTIELSTLNGSQYRVDGGAWQATGDKPFSISVLDHPVELEIRNSCCETKPITVTRDTKNQFVPLQFRMASVTPVCEVPNASVFIDGVTASLKTSYPIQFEAHATSSTKTVTVKFTDGKGIDTQSIQVTAGQDTGVTCALH
jgi:hypothetical protein